MLDTNHVLKVCNINCVVVGLEHSVSVLVLYR